MMTDPDAPSRAQPTMREWRHWVVANIQNNDVSHGNVLTPYMGPSPPAGTGAHRYAFLLFRQQSRLPTTQLQEERGWFFNEKMNESHSN